MANKSTARLLRRRSTDAERILWRHLRNRQLAGLKFRRQAPAGPFIADFLCFKHLLIVELDGGQHALKHVQDAERTAWLQARGYRVIRFWNNEVFENLEGVLEAILRKVRENKPPHPNPLPEGEGMKPGH